jgi:signal transduction histidine kinase
MAVMRLHPRWAATLHNGLLMALAFICLFAGLAQLRRGLSPFDELRARLLAVRQGRERRVDGGYPSEVQPLVNDLNGLLDDREHRVARALARAGDLAHGLKTPLAILFQEAERAEAEGHVDLADAINQQVLQMRRQIDYHLAQARAAASGATLGARCAVIESAEGLARTLSRLYAGRVLDIDVRVSREHAIRGQREDLDEMLGNLLDNACKWAKSRVAVEAATLDTGKSSTVVITVDDDGPGLVESMRDIVLQRGVRADEAAAGHGFGLAIVRDLAELYGGSISLGSSPAGGLRARLQLPAG